MGSVVVNLGLWSIDSIVVMQGLSCSVAIWDLPTPGIEPMSPASADRFFTTEPPGKPYLFYWVHHLACGS